MFWRLCVANYFMLSNGLLSLKYIQIIFVIAPAIILYYVRLQTLIDQVFFVLYVLCNFLYMVRFNIMVHLVPKNTIGKTAYIKELLMSYTALIISTTVAVFILLDLLLYTQVLKSMFPNTIYKIYQVRISVIFLSIAMTSKRLRINFDVALVILIATAATFTSCQQITLSK